VMIDFVLMMVSGFVWFVYLCVRSVIGVLWLGWLWVMRMWVSWCSLLLWCSVVWGVFGL